MRMKLAKGFVTVFSTAAAIAVWLWAQAFEFAANLLMGWGAITLLIALMLVLDWIFEPATRAKHDLEIETESASGSEIGHDSHSTTKGLTG